MKKLYKFTLFFAAFVLFALVSKNVSAAVVWNTHPNDCTTTHYNGRAVGIMVSGGTGGQSGCLPYQSSISASAGQTVSVQIYFHNTGTTAATNTVIKVTPTNSTSPLNISGQLTTSSGPGISGTTTLNYPSDTQVEAVGANYILDGTNHQNIDIQSVMNGFNIGTIPAGSQGALAISLRVVQKVNQTCQDTNATNYGGPLPCSYPQRCQDTNAINYGQIGSCSYAQRCQDANATNYGSYGSCVYAPQCTVSIYANGSSQTTIQSGQGANLTWSSNNCSTVYITPTVGTVTASYNGQQTVYPTSSTIYIINGTNSRGASASPASAIVTVGQPPARPICNDGLDNDGDGKTDSSDPGCYYNGVYDPNRQSEYNVETPTYTGPTVSTTSATSVSTNSCKLNSIVRINTAATTNAYFKYGTSSTDLNFTSAQATVGSAVGGYQFADTISNLRPNTKYYYKVVATNQYGTKEDSTVRSCTTRSNTVYVDEPTTVRTVTRTVVAKPVVQKIEVANTERIIANSAPSLLFLRIDDRREDLTCSDVVDYQVVYKNVSNITLDRAVLEVQLPAGVRYVKSSSGGSYSDTTKTVTFNVGSVMPGQEDAKFIQADVICEEVDSDMLVANANMSYTNPTTNAQEDAAAYDLDKFFIASVNNTRSTLSGAAIFGGGFFPNSLIGWLILILIILGLIYLIRMFILPPRKSNTTVVTKDHDHSNPSVTIHH